MSIGTADRTPHDDEAAEPLICSRKGCRNDAAWGLLWNNPKLHTPERRKVWLACDEHREHLETFLTLRDFLKSTVPVDQIPPDAGARP